MILITDLLRFPFDEGAKNTAFNIISSFDVERNHKIISINGGENVGVDAEECVVNKSFIDIRFLAKVNSLPHANVLYMPESSATLLSFIRSLILSLFAGKHVVFFALQPRRYSGLKCLLFRLLAPKLILTPSNFYADYLRENSLSCRVIPLGVDDVKYRQYDQKLRDDIRTKNNIAKDKLVLLHVGHIRSSRNLEWLLEVKNKLPSIEIVIVGSSYGKANSELQSVLESNGVRVIGQYIENMAELYNMADYYIFPVVDDQGAIATPLSVLEAMSCNVPILTTKFGSLVDMFSPDDYFYYIESSSDVVDILKDERIIKSECNNRQKVKEYTWKAIAGRIENIVEEVE